MNDKSSERLYSMDALRGIAMLLGVITHATLAYTTMSINGLTIESYDRHKIFDDIYLYLHLFRMPLFFIVAGFFARFLYLKIGEKAFIKHRFNRIIFPFLVCLITIRPLTEAPFLFYKYLNTSEIGRGAAAVMAVKNCFHWIGTFHLWFLYYLGIYYCIMLIVAHLVGTSLGKLVVGYPMSLVRRFSLVRTRNLFILVIPVFVLLLPFRTAEIGIDTGSIYPKVDYLLFYGFFFFLGYLLHIRFDELKEMGANTWLGLCGGTIAAVLFFRLRDYNSIFGFNYIQIFYVCKFLTALSTVLLAFGYLGLFVKYFSFRSAALRYMSDSSYWVYLISLSFVLAAQGILSAYTFPAGYKFLLVLVVPTSVSYLTYELFVRYTIIGTCLHGPRRRGSSPRRSIKKACFGLTPREIRC